MQPAIGFQHFRSGLWVEKVLFEDGFPRYAFNADFTDLTSRERAIVIVADLRFVAKPGNDSNLLIVFYVQIMPDDFVMQLHRF